MTNEDMLASVAVALNQTLKALTEELRRFNDELRHVRRQMEAEAGDEWGA